MVIGIFLFMIVLMSITMGFGLAYDAETREEAVYTYEDHLEEADEHPTEDIDNKAAAGMVENGLKMSLWIASVVGYWFYPLTPWIPAWLVAGVLKVLAILPLAFIVWKIASIAGRIRGDPV